MTDEENKAIKDCDSIFICLDDSMSEDSANDYRKSYKILKNLIEKQSKEIEHQIEKRENQKKELAILNTKQIEFNKLVNTLNSYKGQFKRQQKEIEELKEKNNSQPDCEEPIERTEEMVNMKWVNHNYISKDKIKAKIEELEKGNKNTFIRGEKILVLQSLLGKE